MNSRQRRHLRRSWSKHLGLTLSDGETRLAAWAARDQRRAVQAIVTGCGRWRDCYSCGGSGITLHGPDGIQDACGTCGSSGLMHTTEYTWTVLERNEWCSPAERARREVEELRAYEAEDGIWDDEDGLPF